MDGKASASGNKAHNLIPGHRITASGETYCNIVNSFDHDSASGLGNMHLVLRRFGNPLQNHFIRDFLLVLFVILFHKPVYHLAFLKTSVPNGSQHRFPVLESVFLLHHVLIFRIHDIAQINGFGFAIRGNHLFSLDDIAFLEFFLKPLIDLVLCLGALDDSQPVPARASGVLGGQDLDPVPVLYLVFNIHQLAVYPGAYHLISHCAVDGVCEINRRRAIGQILHIALGREAVYILCKQVQIALDQA